MSITYQKQRPLFITSVNREAVKLGVADACIMCLKMPQSSGDHFCGKGCRDEALSRPSSS